MAGLQLTLAVEHYDRHLPLLEGKVVPEGIDLQVLHVTVEEGRHERMLNHREWDACELSLASYIMARTRGAPLTAIPVFPRRLYSQSQMYVNTAAGIAGPQDLIGKRVGLRSFQTTLSVLAKGDLQYDYGVPLDQVTWVTSADEPVPFTPPSGVRIERASRDTPIETMLVEGAIHAYMVPRMPRPFVHGSPQVARLFQDPRAEEMAYYWRNGFYPIMHVLAVKPELLDAHPEVTMRLFDAFERAKEMAFHYYDDPNWSHLAWAVHLLREERQAMGPDAWANGLGRNRKNLERFIQYELDQGLIDGKLEVEELFHETTHST
ncbi:MAG TPA: ABC transporter substrate-binding protein [Candidatus Tectomicrobia bacterium]|nr:ABC transporter substrate-binding protein [Candidatus Tectomicrobia bacterium]